MPEDPTRVANIFPIRRELKAVDPDAARYCLTKVANIFPIRRELKEC